MDNTPINALDEIKDRERLLALFAINDVLKQVESEGLEIETVIPRVLQLAIERLDGRDGSIIVVDADGNIEYAWVYSEEYPNIRPSDRLDEIVERGLAGWVMRHMETVVVENSLNDPRWLQRPGSARTNAIWSVVCTPFVVRERAIGAITVMKRGTDQFNGDDAALLTVIANQTASTIENARLLAESQRQLRITELLNEASKVINASLDINEIMQRLLAQMHEFLNAEAISIALVDRSTNELVYKASEGIGSNKIVGLRLPSNHGLSGWVMEHAEPVLVQNTSKDARFRERLGDKRTGYETRAMICAPIQFKGNVLGTIQAINPIEGNFSERDLDVLVSLANIASSAIANAQQYARTQVAEERYMRLFQDSVDPIILTDSLGHIVEANQRAFEFFGYDRRELLQMDIDDLHAASEDLPQAADIQSDEVQVFTGKVLPKSGRQPMYVQVYAKRTPYGSNELLQWIHHDITKQVELEEMRQDLTAMLVHDLQSPLGNVISSLELIKHEVPADNDSPLSAMVDIAIRSSHHLQTLVNSLLDISRLEAGHPITKQTAVGVNELLDLVYEIEEPNFERREVAFVRDVPANVADVSIEESMIRRVLLNLLDNALKYSHENRQILVTARNVPGEEMVLISVADQGQGIPTAYRERIFEKFQRITTSAESKGLGLGLAFCRLAVEAHGGRIWVDDAPGGGARFNFTLPAADPEE